VAHRYLQRHPQIAPGLSFAVLGFAPAWARPRGSELAVPPGPGFRGGVVAVRTRSPPKRARGCCAAAGNAIDAAAAIQFALNVVEPEFSGIGGGRLHDGGTSRGEGQHLRRRGRERAPASADTTLFTNPDGSNQGFTPASTSGQAVGVPGTLKIVATALQRYGRKRLAEVIQPAIELAENGLPVNFVLADDATSPRTSFYAETAAVFRPAACRFSRARSSGSRISRRRCASSRRRGRTCFTAARSARRSSPRSAPRRTAAARPHDDAGPRRLPYRDPPADRRRVPRLSHRRDVAAVVGRALR